MRKNGGDREKRQPVKIKWCEALKINRLHDGGLIAREINRMLENMVFRCCRSAFSDISR